MMQELDARGQESGRDAQHQCNAESGCRAGEAGADVGCQFARCDHGQRGLQHPGGRREQRRVHPGEHMRDGLPAEDEQNDARQVQQQALPASGAFLAQVRLLVAVGHAGARRPVGASRILMVQGVRLRGRIRRAAHRQGAHAACLWEPAARAASIRL
ncbi:hypothetical protein D3C87_1356890 [compost metagenome]